MIQDILIDDVFRPFGLSSATETGQQFDLTYPVTLTPPSSLLGFLKVSGVDKERSYSGQPGSALIRTNRGDYRVRLISNRMQTVLPSFPYARIIPQNRPKHHDR